MPRFEQIQQRIGLNVAAEVRRKMKQVPVYYFAFDVLYLDGRSLAGRPYEERRERLRSLQLAGSSWQTPEHQVGDGEAMLAASRASGLEGIVAKRLDSVYEEARRSSTRLNSKNPPRPGLGPRGWRDAAGRPPR